MPSVPSPPVSTIQKDTAGLIEEVKKGKILYTPNVPDDPLLQANREFQQREKKFCHSQGIKTTLTMPLITDKTVLGALYFSSIREKVMINENLIYRLACFTKILANIINQKSGKRTFANYISSPKSFKTNSVQQQKKAKSECLLPLWQLLHLYFSASTR